MSAPDKMPDVIWAQAEHDDDPKYGSFWIASKVAPSEPYHHQRVVDELVAMVERLEENCSSHAVKVGPQHAWWDEIFDARALIAKHRKGGKA